MIEREMEDLISAYPNEFFPRKELTFVERQRSFPGVGRFDLLFSDRFANQILMELKRVPARVVDAEQLVKYQEALATGGYQNVILWLVAPTIPKQTEDFLDRYGIEHTVIHEAEFRQVAARHGYTFDSETKATPVSGDVSRPSLSTRLPSTRDKLSFAKTNGKTANEKEFLERCDEHSKWFFSTLFDRQRDLSTITKITWDHESGFSLQFGFRRVGFVPFVWGFPSSTLDGKPRKQRLEFPFHFAARRVPGNFINEFGNALASVVALNTGKKPGIDIDAVSRPELEQVLDKIVDFAKRASAYQAA